MNNDVGFKKFLKENIFLVIIPLFFIVNSRAGYSLFLYLFPYSTLEIKGFLVELFSFLISAIIFAPFTYLFFYFEYKSWKKKKAKRMETNQKITVLNNEFYITQGEFPILYDWISKNKELAPRLVEKALLDCYGSDISKIQNIFGVLNNTQSINHYLKKFSRSELA